MFPKSVAEILWGQTKRPPLDKPMRSTLIRYNRWQGVIAMEEAYLIPPSSCSHPNIRRTKLNLSK